MTSSCRLIHSHRFVLPMLPLCTGVKCHPLPHLRLSHWGGCGELAQDPCTQQAAWMGLLCPVIKHPWIDHIPNSFFVKAPPRIVDNASSVHMAEFTAFTPVLCLDQSQGDKNPGLLWSQVTWVHSAQRKWVHPLWEVHKNNFQNVEYIQV